MPARVYDIPTPQRRVNDNWPERPKTFWAQMRWGWHRLLHEPVTHRPWARAELIVTVLIAISGLIFILPFDTFGASRVYAIYRDTFNNEVFWGLFYALPAIWSMQDIIRYERYRLPSQTAVLCVFFFMTLATLLSRSPTPGFVLYPIFLWVLYWSYERTKADLLGAP